MNSTGINFTKLFKPVPAKEISDSFNIFTLVGDDYFAITAGDDAHYNAMTGSGGGFGLLFKKPATWCVIRSDRYTLELILKKGTYTLSYFPDEYREQMLFLGSKSGRDNEKMKETELTGIQTPSGNIAFKEAKLIVECKLIQVTTPDPNDFCTQEAKDYLNKAYKTATDYRKYLYGEITGTWIKEDFL